MVSIKVLSRVLVALVILDNVFILTWQSSIDWQNEEMSSNVEDFWYVIFTLGVTGAFSIGHAVKATFYENKFDLIPFLLANTILTLAASNMDNFNLLGVSFIERVVVLVCFWLFHFLFVYLAWLVKQNMGWRFFTVFGADLKLRHAYTYWQAYYTVRSLDCLLAGCVVYTEIYFNFLGATNLVDTTLPLIFITGAVVLEQAITLVAGWCVFPQNTTSGFSILSFTHVLFLGYSLSCVYLWWGKTWYTDVLNFLIPAILNRFWFAFITYKLKGYPAWSPPVPKDPNQSSDSPSVKIESLDKSPSICVDIYGGTGPETVVEPSPSVFVGGSLSVRTALESVSDADMTGGSNSSFSMNSTLTNLTWTSGARSERGDSLASNVSYLSSVERL